MQFESPQMYDTNKNQTLEGLYQNKNVNEFYRLVVVYLYES